MSLQWQLNEIINAMGILLMFVRGSEKLLVDINGNILMNKKLPLRELFLKEEQ